MHLHGSLPVLRLTTSLVLVCQTPVSASTISDVVLYCTPGPNCTVLDQSGTGPASGSAPFCLEGQSQASRMRTGGILHAAASYNFLTPGSCQWPDQWQRSVL